MSELIALWMPILASAVAIFIASFVSWVIIGHHNADWSALPDQAENVRKLGELNLPTGRYVFPYDRSKEEREDETVMAAVASGVQLTSGAARPIWA